MLFRATASAKNRKYTFEGDVCEEVLSSLKFNKKGYHSIKAVCSDGVIRTVYLNQKQKGIYLRGLLYVYRNKEISGWVDTTEFAKRFSNVGIVFFADPTNINADLLPNWCIPGWNLPAKVNDIR